MKKWNLKLIGISLAILAVVVIVSMLIFPEWKTRFGVIGAAVLIIVVAAPEIVDFLSKAKKLYTKEEKKDTPPPTEVHIEGGDNITGDKIIMGDDKSTVINAKDNATVQQIENQTNIYNPEDLTPTSLHQLRAPVKDFTGREKELDDLCKALKKNEDKEQEGALLSGLRGMGGVGKTALALKLAEKLTPDYPDAQLFVPMYGADETRRPPATPAEAMQHVIRAFHPTAKLPEDPGQLATLYRSVLHEKKALILLDDARNAEQVRPLLPPATCLLLVTTRKHFTLPGLHELDLNTMSEEEAVKLIGKITPRVGQEAAAIAKACGYLPLALRLAASALREQANLSIATLLARLNDAEKRFTTLEKVQAAIQVSYDLLSDELKTAFRQLAVFPTDFIQVAGQAIWEVDAEAAQERLAALMNASLVDYDPKTERYRLHDLVRAAAEKLLEEKEGYQAISRHAAHYLQVLRIADELYLQGGDKILNALNLFDREWENILAGQAWAAKHKKDKNAAQLCADFPDAGIYCLSLRLHPLERIRWLEDALSAAREIGDRRGEGAALGNLGIAYASLGQYQQAIEHYNQHLEIAREIGDRRGEANTSWNLGLLLAGQGKLQEAIDLMQVSVEFETEIDHPDAAEDAARLEKLKSNV
ncbi:MAG: tetratricopeptide repeat protein [Anaerolineaceae bacterium]|nr:tetratricopeptide repeat protein [Anaerolineaceae bacterium]